MAEGVLAGIGDSAMTGLSTADAGLAEEGVLSGPIFGVLRAEILGVLSSVVEEPNCVSI